MLTVHCLWMREIHVRVTVVIREIIDINSVKFFPTNLYIDSQSLLSLFPAYTKMTILFFVNKFLGIFLISSIVK